MENGRGFKADLVLIGWNFVVFWDSFLCHHIYFCRTFSVTFEIQITHCYVAESCLFSRMMLMSSKSIFAAPPEHIKIYMTKRDDRKTNISFPQIKFDNKAQSANLHWKMRLFHFCIYFLKRWHHLFYLFYNKNIVNRAFSLVNLPFVVMYSFFC